MRLREWFLSDRSDATPAAAVKPALEGPTGELRASHSLTDVAPWLNGAPAAVGVVTTASEVPLAISYRSPAPRDLSEAAWRVPEPDWDTGDDADSDPYLAPP